MNNHQKEQQLEEQHLAQCLKIIQQNIHLYEDKESQYKKSPSVLPEGLLFALKKTLNLRKILSLVRLPFRHIRLYSGTFSAPEQKIYYHRFLDLASLF